MVAGISGSNNFLPDILGQGNAAYKILIEYFVTLCIL